jgi:molybdopterin converting factor small subunit
MNDLVMQHSQESPHLEIHNLAPDPAEEWRRLLDFVGLSPADKLAMSRTVEVLMRRAPELVADTYNYLQSVPETAAILGWEDGADEEHLEERRRFFTIWIARVLGLDTSAEFALYLFRAGKFHAAHGPRRIHVPSSYVTTSIGLVGASFAQYMEEASLPGSVVAPAMAGWNKYLSVQLQLMLLGYEVAREFGKGDIAVPISLFGRMRNIVGSRELKAHTEDGSPVEEVLRKFFNYYPQARAEALQTIWHADEKPESNWMEVYPSFAPRPGGWRVLLNGRDLAYAGGFKTAVHSEDQISIFPPGR